MSDRVAETVGKRRALLICNGTFDDPGLGSLEGAARDHEQLSKVLGGPRAAFDVTALLDAGFLEVRKAIAKICHESATR